VAGCFQGWFVLRRNTKYEIYKGDERVKTGIGIKRIQVNNDIVVVRDSISTVIIEKNQPHIHLWVKFKSHVYRLSPLLANIEKRFNELTDLIELPRPLVKLVASYMVE
jgi:hypothetical protein